MLLGVMVMLVMLMVAASPLTSACHPGLSPGRSTTAGGWIGEEEGEEEEKEEEERGGVREEHLTMQSRLACLAKILIGPFPVSFATNKSSTLVIILVK